MSADIFPPGLPPVRCRSFPHPLPSPIAPGDPDYGDCVRISPISARPSPRRPRNVPGRLKNGIGTRHRRPNIGSPQPRPPVSVAARAGPASPPPARAIARRPAAYQNRPSTPPPWVAGPGRIAADSAEIRAPGGQIRPNSRNFAPRRPNSARSVNPTARKITNRA